MRHILADTGVWYALFDRHDPYNSEACDKAEYLDSSPIVLPWPILYETLRTKFIKNTTALQLFHGYLTRRKIIYLDDRPYRDAALDHSFSLAMRRERHLSLTDSVIRLILDDVNIRIRGFITFNARDFVDICRKRRIEML